jgi:quinone-modifying oxidoreductase subunit QmoB
MRVGLFICTGCGIGESLNIERLCEAAENSFCKTHPHLCKEDGLSLIKEQIEKENIERLAIAACSDRAKQFSFDRITERIALREYAVWPHKPKEEETQSLAEDYIRMGLIKCEKIAEREPYLLDEVSKCILVVGGGISGITSALSVAKTGRSVYLVEKDTLGGRIARLYKQTPKIPPYTEIEDVDIEKRIKELRDNPNVKVFEKTKVERISGQPGDFSVKLKNGESFKVGAIILATGAVPYDKRKLTELGGELPNVVTNAEFEEMAKDGKIPESVCFIQCAGSRNENHLPYCSSFCCTTTLKQALYIREKSPDSVVYIIYKDLRAPGKYELFYSKAQEDPGIFFTKGEVEKVEEENGKLKIFAKDTLLGEDVLFEADLVVLAVGIISTAAIGVEQKEEDRETEAPPDMIIKSDILNLDYRQGPELPSLKYGFCDSHFICFPYETRRTGIYAAGTVRAPMDIASAIIDAEGAALKAIQSIKLVEKGEAVHPRVFDRTYPDLFMQRCTQCKRCTEECPFGAYNEDEKYNPLPNPTRCRRCGTCLGSCPERIISFADFSIDIISSQIKAIEIPEDEEELRVLCFLCENDALPALERAERERLEVPAQIRFIPLRCLGSINLVWISDALSAGFDGIMLIGCKYGDDYQCHFIKGSELANYRIPKVQETLDRLALEAERIRILQLSIDEYNLLPEIFSDFMKKLEELGPNPFKGF